MSIRERMVKRLWSIRSRCESPKASGYKWYGAKGIKCLLSVEDLILLWNTSDAGSMKKPTIDRIDSQGHYVLSNCRFIEKSENSKRIAKSPTCPKGHLYTKENTIVKKNHGYIGRACKECHSIGKLKYLRRIGHKPKSFYFRPVEKLDADGKVIESYASISEAAKANNNDRGISNVVRGKQKTSRGFKYRFAN